MLDTFTKPISATAWMMMAGYVIIASATLFWMNQNLPAYRGSVDVLARDYAHFALILSVIGLVACLTFPAVRAVVPIVWFLGAILITAPILDEGRSMIEVFSVPVLENAT